MKKVLILVIVVVLGWLAYQFFRPVHYMNLPPTAHGEWIAFGDSLTAGYGASDGNDYPTLLSKQLGVSIRNLGVVGDTTADGLNRVAEAAKLQPRVVLLCLGGNDGLQRISSDAMISNLHQIIAAFQQQGSFVVLIGVRSASLFDKNDGRFKKLATQEHVLYVPNILDGLLGSPALMSDQIHPNEQGYKIIADRLANVLRPLLPQLN